MVQGATVTFLLPSDMGKAAEWYASTLGWRVFPLHSVVNGVCTCSKGAACGQPGKHPRISIPSGEGAIHPATIESKTIRLWWKKWPNANIGFWLDGADVLVLDIDKSDKKDGFKGLEEIIAFEGQDGLPATLTCDTPSGGRHHYFKMTSGVPNKANTLGPGLDTWHTAHYVILPPSTHMKGTYAWKAGTVTIADYPEWLKPKVRGGGADPVRKGRPAKERIDPTDPDDVARLRHALKHVPSEDRDRWVLTAFALARAFEWSDAGFEMYNEWSATAHNYDPVKTKEQYYKQSRVMAGSPVTCASIFEWATKDASYKPIKKIDTRPYEIREHSSNHPLTLGAMADIIGNYPIYQRGPNLVEVVPINQDTQMDGFWAPKGSYVLRSVLPDQLASRILPMRCRWMKLYKDGWSPAACSVPLCSTFLGIGNWPTAMNLRAFVQHPTLRDDGSIVQAAGYDKASGLFVTDEIAVKVKDKPTKADAIKALAVLMQPFSEYKWLDGAISGSALMAALFTVGLRHLLNDAVPLFAIDAPKAGSGKSKLVKAITNLWFGRPAASTPYSADPEEMRKHLASILLAGDRVILFDNVMPITRINDPTLNALMTNGRATFRELGSNRMLDLESTATFFITGNKLNIVGDMIRRTIRLKIDPQGLNPTERVFKIDPLEDYIMEHRVRLLSAALTCARAFFIAGKPKGKLKPIASFEQWSKIIRNMLVWLGLDDVQETIALGHEQDDEGSDTEHLLRLLFALPEFQAGPVPSSLLLPVIENNKGLSDAMLPFAPQRVYGINHPRVVTSVLTRVADLELDGKRLERVGALWIVRECA